MCQPYSLLGQLPYVALYPSCIVVEFLTLLPARCIEGILQSIEEFRFVFTLERVRLCLQDHVHSIVSGHILWFQSVASIPSWACYPAQNTWPLQIGWSARERKPQFRFLTITLGLALVGTSELLSFKFNVRLLNERCAIPPTGDASLPPVIEIVSPNVNAALV